MSTIHNDLKRRSMLAFAGIALAFGGALVAGTGSVAAQHPSFDYGDECEEYFGSGDDDCETTTTEEETTTTEEVTTTTEEETTTTEEETTTTEEETTTTDVASDSPTTVVSESGGNLPSTGSGSAAMAMIAFGLLMVGGAVIMGVRRPA